jgi:uronate dehydrogenase
VRRVVLASSNHAVGFTPRSDTPLPATVPPRPDTYYGVSKVVMEALGSLYADRYGMDIASLRIGTCLPQPVDTRSLAIWLSPDDVARLVEACLAAPPFGHRIVWGVSANTRRWWSLAEGEALGFQPTSDAEGYAAVVPPSRPEHLQIVGGEFTEAPLGVRPVRH